MINEIKWSPVAEEDFYNILQYLIEKFGLKVADDFQVALNQTLSIILINPFAFPSFRKKNIRKCVFNSRLSIYYLIKEDGTIFLLTLFGRQNPAKLKKLIRKSIK